MYICINIYLEIYWFKDQWGFCQVSGIFRCRFKVRNFSDSATDVMCRNLSLL